MWWEPAVESLNIISVSMVESLAVILPLTMSPLIRTMGRPALVASA